MKIIKFTILSFTLSVIMYYTSSAQISTKDNLAFVSVPGKKSLEARSVEIGLPMIATPDAKLIAKVTRLFPHAVEQKWWIIDNFYQVSFLDKGRKSRAVFTKGGKFNYAIADCKLDHLPALLQKRIRKDYPAYILIQAIEITAHNTIAHQVILEHETGYVTLKATLHNVEEVDFKNKLR